MESGSGTGDENLVEDLQSEKRVTGGIHLGRLGGIVKYSIFTPNKKMFPLCLLDSPIRKESLETRIGTDERI